MRKAVVTGLFTKPEETFGNVPEQACFGNNLHYPGKLSADLLSQLGFSCFSEADLPFNEADLLLCVDLSVPLWQRLQQVHSRVKKILIVAESPIYAPLSHDGANVLRNSFWNLVMTWNRGYHAEYILHYDLPFAGRSVSTPIPAKSEHFLDDQQRGVVVASYKRDYRGFFHDRNRLYTSLASDRDLALYGRRWGNAPKRQRMGLTSDKLQTISDYAFSLVVENILVNGYVTEKIADSILAGTPVIYWGDWETAERRFPGTFVPLKKVDRASFYSARERLFSGYEEYLQCVEEAKEKSDGWCDSYLAVLKQAIETLFPA
jgi:hypothetical protein